MSYIISLCLGIIIFFILDFNPNISHPAIISILCALNIFAYRKTKIALIFTAVFGFFYSAFYTDFIDTKMLKRVMRDTQINGTITNIDYTPTKTRVFLITDDLTVRATLPINSDIPKIGDTVATTATIFPINGPDADGAFDFSRWAYFNNIGATGYITDIKIIKPGDSNSISTLRDYMHHYFNSKLFDSLVLGYGHTMNDYESDVWKASGVQHIFSISGFHMTLVGGWFLLMFFLIFRAIPYTTKRFPAKYPATVLAWIALLVYLFLSGAAVATVRAFLMTSLMFLAFLFERNVFTLRNVWLAFGFLLLLNPHYLMEPGFALSFSAIIGMIWWFGDLKYKKRTVFKRILFWIKTVLQTTIIATIFTAPLVIFFFHNLPTYSLLGNIIFMPIFSFLIMPLTFLGLTNCAEYIYNWSFMVAEKIYALPFSTVQFPIISGTALLVIIAAYLTFMFYKKWIGILLITIAIFMIAFKPKPVFYISPDMELAGFRVNDKLEFSKSRSSKHPFTFDTWRQINFEKTGTKIVRHNKCKSGVCEFSNIVYIQKFIPLMKDIEKWCEYDFLVSYFEIKDSENCKAKIINNGAVIYENGRIKNTINRWRK